MEWKFGEEQKIRKHVKASENILKKVFLKTKSIILMYIIHINVNNKPPPEFVIAQPLIICDI